MSEEIIGQSRVYKAKMTQDHKYVIIGQDNGKVNIYKKFLGVYSLYQTPTTSSAGIKDIAYSLNY